MRALGARLVEHGDDFQEAREEAMRIAESVGLEPVPAYHVDLVRGVATYALELLREHADLDVLYVPIGQGSGAVGCIFARNALGTKTEIVGVQAKGAPAYALSFAAGRAVATNAADTLADGMATRVPDADALAVIAKGVERVALVSDDEIAEAIRIYWRDAHNLAEGAGAAPLAAALQERERLRGKKSASCSPAATSTSNCSNAGSLRPARRPRDIRIRKAQHDKPPPIRRLPIPRQSANRIPKAIRFRCWSTTSQACCTAWSGFSPPAATTSRA